MSCSLAPVDYRSSYVFGGLGITKISKVLSFKLRQTVDDIVEFVSIRQFPILAYSGGAVLMRLLKVPTHLIAQALIPTFLFYMFFADGQEGARKLIKTRAQLTKDTVFQPKKGDVDVSKELKRRHRMHCQILKKISPKIHKYWGSQCDHLNAYENILVHGSTGVGKSDYLKVLAADLEAKGHPVYFLCCDQFSGMGHSFKMLAGDPRSLRVRLYLNGVSLTSKKPPVLIIDDGKEVMNPTMPGLGTDIKDGNGIMKNRFSIVFAMAADPSALDSSWDEALRRFSGNIYKLNPLEKEGLIHMLNKIKKEKFKGVTFSDDLIEYVVEKVIENTEKENLWLDRATKVLSLTTLKACRKNGPNAKAIAIDERMVEKVLESQTWYED